MNQATDLVSMNFQFPFIDPYRVPILFAMFLFTFSPSSRSAETISFRFNPPDGLTYEGRSFESSYQEFGEGNVHEGEVKFHTRLRWAVGPSGIEQHETVLPHKFRLEGDYPDYIVKPALRAMEGVSLVYRLSPEGKLISLEGSSTLRERALEAIELKRDAAPPGKVPGLRAMSEYFTRQLSDDAHLESVRHRYDDELASLHGRRMKLGEVQTRIIHVFVQGIWIPCLEAFRLEEEIPWGSRKAVRLSFEYRTEASQLRSFVGPEFDLPLPPENPSTFSIVGVGERTLEPSTLLTIRARTEQTVRIPVRGSRGRDGMEFSVEDVQYDYGDYTTGADPR